MTLASSTERSPSRYLAAMVMAALAMTWCAHDSPCSPVRSPDTGARPALSSRIREVGNGGPPPDARLNLESLADRPTGPVAWERERFVNERDRERLLALRNSTLGRTRDWIHIPPTALGESLRERWCGPRTEERACISRSIVRSREPGTRWLEIGMARRPERSPDLFGLVISAGTVPAHDEWGVVLDYSSGAGDLAEQGFRVTYLHIGDDGTREVLTVGTRYEIPLGMEPCVVWAPSLPALTRPAQRRAIDAELARLLESPISFRDTVWARLDALLDQASLELAEHSVRRCADRPGGERPSGDACVPVVLTADEETQALESVRRETARRRALIEIHLGQFHSLLAQLVPIEVIRTE